MGVDQFGLVMTVCGIRDPEVERLLSEATAACGFPGPRIECDANCYRGDRCADTTPGKWPIVHVCMDGDYRCPSLKQQLIHELTHARQFCESPTGDFLNCNDRICGELEAYTNQGGCGGYLRRDWKMCCQAACQSVIHDTRCFPLGGCQVHCEWIASSCRRGRYDPYIPDPLRFRPPPQIRRPPY